MYKVEHVQFRVEDYPSNFKKILNHENILIKGFKLAELWSTYDRRSHTDEYKVPEKNVYDFDAYLKIKHSRRYKEAQMLWNISVNDILAIVK